MRLFITLGCLIALSAFFAVLDETRAQTPTVYHGMCDASAAVALGKDHFIVGDDELNVLRIYKRDQPEAVGQVDLSSFLGTKPKKESDIEGAARLGNKIFWISSHGINSDGEVQDRRRKLFATEILEGAVPTVLAVKQPYSKLVDDLSVDPKLVKYNLAEAAKKPPKTKGALNIEGLADFGDGKLLIGFRNPLQADAVNGDLAFLVPLENPDDVIGGASAKFGDPIEVFLGGRGVRSIEKVGGTFLIVAGPIDGKGAFDLYRWSGDRADKPVVVPTDALKGLNPEALFAIPETADVQILSDDGTVDVAGKECKEAPRAAQSFRSVIVKP